MGEDAGSFAAAVERADDVEEIGVIALFGGRGAEVFEAVEGVVVGVDAVAPKLRNCQRRLSLKGGLATTKWKVLRVSPSLNFGSARVLPWTIWATGLLWRIMFMRARPAVAASFS